MISPCKDCKDRSPKCHGSCKKYRAWAKWRKKQSKLERENYLYTEENCSAAEYTMYKRKWKR